MIVLIENLDKNVLHCREKFLKFKSLKRKSDNYNVEPFEDGKGGQNELRCYHVIMHVYCNSYNRMAKMKEWEWQSATNWSNWNSGNYDEKII